MGFLACQWTAAPRSRSFHSLPCVALIGFEFKLQLNRPDKHTDRLVIQTTNKLSILSLEPWASEANILAALEPKYWTSSLPNVHLYTPQGSQGLPNAQWLHLWKKCLCIFGWLKNLKFLKKSSVFPLVENFLLFYWNLAWELACLLIACT